MWGVSIFYNKYEYYIVNWLLFCFFSKISPVKSIFFFGGGVHTELGFLGALAGISQNWHTHTLVCL